MRHRPLKTSALVMAVGAGLAGCGERSCDFLSARRSDSHSSEIVFTVKNCGDSSLKVLEGDLPWASTLGLDMRMYDAAGRKVGAAYPINDPSPGNELAIAPGKAVEGVVDLKSHFPKVDFDADIGQRTLVWTHSPSTEWGCRPTSACKEFVGMLRL
jgi:hypothetical protein